MINRRDLLRVGIATGAATALSNSVRAEEDEPLPFRIIDTNISLFQWPFRRLPLDDPGKLVKKLRSLGIVQGWAGSFEGLLHRDIGGVNRRLAAACKNLPELVPIGSVNPQLPDWKDDLRRCVEVHNMPGIRLHPNYHGYTLDDPRFASLLKFASASGRFVQVTVAMEDIRTQHPMLRVPDVDLSPLPGVKTEFPKARVQMLNYRPRGALLKKLAETPGVYFDTARVEGTDGVPKLVESVPAGRVMFGTHAPFLIPEAALVRTHESGRLQKDSLQELLRENALRLMERFST